MDIETEEPIPSPGEHEVDFSISQLVETSPAFREWFIGRATPHDTVEEYVGTTIHAAYAGEGESDIEFGVITADDERHLVLVENKIDAPKQPDQFQRYYNRGRFRTEREDWDSTSVCLLAPEAYPDADDRESVDAVVTYEEVADILSSLDHDAAGFCRSVFVAALRKRRVVTDASETLRAVAGRVRENPHLDYLEPVQGQKKSLVFGSTHPEHPEPVGYNVYVAETGTDGWTKVRLKLWNAGELSDHRLEELKSVVSSHTESLPDYDWKLDRKEDIAAKTLWHDEIAGDVGDETYVQGVVSELHELVSTLHPIFVEERFEEE